MTNSSWRIGDMYFPVGQEPERATFKSTIASPLYSQTHPNTPYTRHISRGKGVSNLNIQGTLPTFTEGSDGAWGLEKLLGVCSYNGGEQTIHALHHDGTVRKYYGHPSIQYDLVATRKNRYAYNVSVDCYNPFAFDTTLSNTAAINVGSTDTTIDLGTDAIGTTISYPTFIIQNDTGGALNAFTMTIGDGATSITGNSIVTPSTNLAAGSELIIYPYKWNDTEWRNELWQVYSRTGATTPTGDAYTLYQTSDLTEVGTVQLPYPIISSETQDLQAKGSAANANLIVQWRKAYA